MLLTYQAVDSEGKHCSDTVDANSTRDAVNILRSRGLFVTQISESERDHSQQLVQLDSRPPRMPLRTLTLFTRQMAMLLRAGSGLVPAVTAIARQMSHPRHRALLRRIIIDLEEGSTLTEALRAHPDTFDPVYCAVVAAGEASASLAKVFDRLAVLVQRRRALRKKILGTLAYPCLLIVMCVSILQVLVFFVLPRFADMFTQLHVEAPASTQALLSLGKAISGYWPVLLIGTAALCVGGALGARTETGKQWLSDIQLCIPFLGRLRSRLIQGQVLRTMGMLTESRVGLLETLELASRSTRNSRFRKMFASLEHAVTSGGSLSTAFEESGIVEPAICEAVRTGEESGNLSEALSYCADILDESNEELINVLARLIEPAILICMGFVVGGVAIALFLPLFDLTSAIR
ncbi:MAG: type II secretion system F family protein [Phycisphaerae bacterium]